MARKTLIRCLGEEVRDRRKALGFSQIALAHEAEIHPNRINLDTGAYATGKLSCLVLEGDSVAFI